MIVLAATPIGNLGDASVRLRETFEHATVIAAEDTRHTAQLLRLLGVQNRPELLALHDHNEHQRAEELVERAKHEDIVLVSDAGMPTVSDPGYRVVQQAAVAGVQVTVIPGPSAVMAALAVSGLATDRFAFEGFLPRKVGDRGRFLASLAAEPRTLVFFEAPTRLAAMLREVAEHFGVQRRAAVCRELTKLHEEVRRGTLHELAVWAEGGVKGEIVVVVAGAPAQQLDETQVLGEVLRRVEAGERLKEVAREVAQLSGLSARELYGAALRERAGGTKK